MPPAAGNPPDPRPAPLPRDPERLAFLHAPDATLILSQRRILRASLRVEQVFGWRPQELQGQSIRLLYPGLTDFERIGDRARRAMGKGGVYCDERFMRCKDGAVVWMAGRGQALDQGDPERLAVWTYRPSETGISPVGGLTPAELRIAGYLVNGFTSKEIAQSLSCSHRTVEVHRANMIRKMNVRNSFELVNILLGAGERRSPAGPRQP
ncbi:LuxR family transcriptional regulator [Pseudogemmobacter faecipullorum]|uniref:PAS domain S-box protein n=1 Tax=Pseudogemmobacter faecipullorum TaxID=2755041 RepID=A0ABS8CN56_9RHOB|nr:LuxR C-terminal-related transcriptional regulator [Pseudogemmobacter faecipullorum]MCB5410813.1 PAS domain S-box protein [Pseudogemmobacter faecipullorum]